MQIFNGVCFLFDQHRDIFNITYSHFSLAYIYSPSCFCLAAYFLIFDLLAPSTPIWPLPSLLISCTPQLGSHLDVDEDEVDWQYWGWKQLHLDGQMR